MCDIVCVIVYQRQYHLCQLPSRCNNQCIKINLLTFKYFKCHMYISLYIYYTLNKRQSFPCEQEPCLFTIQSALYFDFYYQSILQQTHYICFIKWLGWSFDRSAFNMTGRYYLPPGHTRHILSSWNWFFHLCDRKHIIRCKPKTFRDS